MLRNLVDYFLIPSSGDFETRCPSYLNYNALTSCSLISFLFFLYLSRFLPLLSSIIWAAMRKYSRESKMVQIYYTKLKTEIRIKAPF
jgi:hypothetical protein